MLGFRQGEVKEEHPIINAIKELYEKFKWFFEQMFMYVSGGTR